MHTSKTHLHVEPFSLKQPEVSRESSVTIKAVVRNIHMDSVGRKRSNGLEPVPQEGSQERRRIIQIQGSSLGARGFNHTETPS